MSKRILEGTCYRENCKGKMIYDDGIYICNMCGIASRADNYISWLLEGDGSNPLVDDDYVGVPGYEELYDMDGEFIFCPDCLDTLTPLKLHDGKVVCPRCSRVYELEEFGDLM